MPDASRRAFVVMPFSDDLSWVFDDVLAPLLRGLDYEPIRADTTLNQQNLLADIITGITESDVIIADLTGLNPNVMYELGLAHGLRRPVIMLTQAINTAPFDLRSYRLTPYTDRYPDVEALKNALKQTLEAHIGGTVRFSNPVDDFYPVNPQGGTARGNGADSEQVIQSDEAPLGLLDYEERFGELAQATTTHMQEVSARAEQFSETLNEITAEVQSIQPNDPASTRKRVVLSNTLARAVGDYASDLQNSTSPLLETWAEMESTFEGILRTANITTPDDAEAARELTVILDNFTTSLEEASGALQGARTEIGAFRAISRELGRATPRLERAMGSMMSAIDVGAAFGNRIKRVLEQRIQEFEDDGESGVTT